MTQSSRSGTEMLLQSSSSLWWSCFFVSDLMDVGHNHRRCGCSVPWLWSTWPYRTCSSWLTTTASATGSSSVCPSPDRSTCGGKNRTDRGLWRWWVILTLQDESSVRSFRSLNKRIYNKVQTFLSSMFSTTSHTVAGRLEFLSGLCDYIQQSETK